MGKVKCPDCKGLGGYMREEENCKVAHRCDTCNGTGYVWKKPTPEQMRAVAKVIKESRNGD